MNRPFRFRIWEVVAKTYSQSHVIGGDGVVFLGASPDLAYDTPVSDDSIVVEQFTGLTDAKSVDIYEGDVVSGGFPDGTGWMSNRTGQVSWNDHQARFDVICADRETCQLSRVRNVVIDGNIHEHPHFLLPPS